MALLPVAGPWVTNKEIELTAEAAASAWYEGAGRYTTMFEEQFAAYVGRQHAIALPSCTAALHLSLLALGVGPGDEVVVPDVTWIASVAPVVYVGATPVFADIDPVTWCLSRESVEAVLSSRTAAIVPVDLYGGMPAFDDILELATDRRVAVVEDAAEAVGSRYHDAAAGSFGATSAFSFHGSKTLTTGEGGMVTTDDPALHDRMRVLRDHGRRPGDTMFFNDEVAYKYKMSELQAAFGLAQTQRAEELVERKRELFAWYAEELADVPGMTLNAEPPGTRNSYWMVTVVLDPALGLRKEALAAQLRERGADSRPFFHPLSEIPAFAATPQAEEARARNRVAYEISPYGLNLPSAMKLTRDEVHTVCAALAEIIAAAK